jgi:hypothetical protein
MNRDRVIESVRYIMQGPRAFEAERLDKIAEALKPWTPESAAYRLAATGHTEEPSIGMKWRSQTKVRVPEIQFKVGTHPTAHRRPALTVLYRSDQIGCRLAA